MRRIAASDDGGRVAAKHRANQSAVARKNYTGAETYGEPQTPADPR
ncbi:MAG TPA: hypothetical protein VEW05_11235 [Candidatus Polarisedimenticolia bacterium]|nr:hypothetical protein [Candidatus Polarisedimenticolia bacterium]